MQREEITELVEAEQTEIGVMAAEIAADGSAKQAVGEADDPQYRRNVDAVGECEHAGVTSQFMAELTEGAQAFFSLGHEVGVGFKGAEAQRVVDVGDGNAVSAQLLAEEHVLIAIVAEALVEGVGEHQVTTDEEIGGVEVLIRMQSSLLCGMLMLSSLLIAIAEIALQCIGIAAYADTTVDDIGSSRRYIPGEIVRTHKGHVAVDEQQVVVSGLSGKVVADGSPADILGLPELMAVRPLVDLAVFRDDIRISRAIVGHKNLIVETSRLSLLPEVVHQPDAQIVIGGNQYR